jgi:O-antigen/teichoic acid export membrane protein
VPSDARKITFDTAAIFAAKVISLLLGIVRLKYIAMYLGVSKFGIYTFALYFVAMFAIFFDAGLGQILTRDIAADRSRTQSYVFNSLVLKSFLIGATAILIAFAAFLSRFDRLTNEAIAFSLFITGVNSLTLIFTSVFQAYRKMQLVSIITIATDLSTSIAVITLLILGYGLFGLLVGSAIASLLVFFLAMFVCRGISGRFLSKVSYRLWSYFFKEGIPLAIAGFGIVLYLYVTSALLKYMQGDQAAGYYNAALKIITILTVIPSSFTPVVYPFFSELFNKDKNKLQPVLDASVRYMLIISIPLSVGTILIAKKLILTLYTPEFLPSVLPLQILIVSSLFSYAHVVFYTFFAAVNRQRFAMFVTIPTGILVAVVNYLLIPSFGIMVPSISLAAVEVIMFASAYFYLLHIGMRLNLYRMFSKPILSCLPMVLVVLLLSGYSVFIQVAAAIMTYGAAFYLFKGISEEDEVILERFLPVPIKRILLKKVK